MIIDKIEKLNLYSNISSKVVNFVQNIDGDILLGRHVISDNIYANVEKYNTKPIANGKFEAHRDYIDIQLLLKGEEKIFYTEQKGLSVSVPYSYERDIEFYSDDISNSPYIKLDGTNFMMIFPHEAHAPQIAVQNPEEVLKVVVKVKF